jgi:hypothetical protein
MKYLGVVSNMTIIAKEELTPSLLGRKGRQGLLGDLTEGDGTSWMEARECKGDDVDVERGLDGVSERRGCLLLIRESRRNMRDAKDPRFSKKLLIVN